MKIEDQTPGRVGTVLHFTPSVGGGGAEAMLCNLVEAMHGGPWRNVVVAVKTGGDGCQAERMKKTASAFYDLNSTSLLRPALFKRLRAIIQLEKPDVVQTWMHHADFVGGLAARISGVKNIVWGIHSRSIFRWPGDSSLKFALFNAAIRIASRAVPQRIVSCSESAIQDHASMGFPRKKMASIANGICTRRFQPSVEAGVKSRLALRIPLDAPVVGFVGRFHPVKNLALFFRAAAELQKRMPEARFVVSGGSAGMLDDKASAAYRALPDRRAMRFVPFNSTTESLYPAFSVFTLCSESESLPMTILEAMACGVPCVTTDVGDCARVIADTGLVVPPGDHRALADGWEKMLGADSAMRNTLSRRARERIVSQFSITHAAGQYESTYRSLIESVRPPRIMDDKQTILHVITSLNLGGAETMMCQLLEHTDRSRFTPVVVSLRPSGPLAERIKKAGVMLHCLDMGSYFSFAAGLGKLKAIMREVNPALVQTWMYHADFLGTLAARGSAPRPSVVWNVQHSSFCPKTTKLLSRVMRSLLAMLSKSWPDKIVSCSRAGLELHTGLGYPREKILHIVNGADTSRFMPDDDARRELRQKLGVPAEAKVIGMAGRNDPQKDYPTLFAAIQEFQKTDKKTFFIACGAGVTTDDSALAAMRSACPSPHNIFLLGPRQDMPRVYPTFDLATLSSVYGEGFPLTLCEALACGVPGVVTDVGDSADVIGDCGITVQPRDPHALAAAWRKMLDLPADAQQKMREKSRIRAEERFALPAIAAQYEELYLQLIAARESNASEIGSVAIPKSAVA